MHPKSSFVIVAIAALGLAAPAGAQGVPPGTQGGQPQAPQQQGMVSAEQAIRIANQHGVVSIDEVGRDDGEWEVEGRDAQGREIEVKIDARTGQVVKIER